MGTIVDLIIILIICLFTFLGYKKGLAKCLLQICTTVLALIIAFLIYKPFVNFIIDNTTIDENIQISLEEVMGVNAEQNTSEETQLVKEDSGIPKPIVDYLNNNVKGVIDDNKSNVISSAARSAAILIVDIAGLIVIYMIAKLILRIFAVLTDIVTKLPLIKQCNEVGGTIYGLLQGILIVLIVMTLISVITPLTGNYYLANLILESYLGNFLYNNNIFLNIIF